MEIQSDTKAEIMETVEKSDKDLSIKEIAEKTGMHRNTVSKYVTVLNAEGKLKVTRRVGNAIFMTEGDGR